MGYTAGYSARGVERSRNEVKGVEFLLVITTFVAFSRRLRVSLR